MLILSFSNLTIEWIVYFARLYFSFDVSQMYFYWLFQPKVFNLGSTDAIQGVLELGGKIASLFSL